MKVKELAQVSLPGSAVSPGGEKGILRMAETCFVYLTILHKPEIAVELKP
jgi:hypothetical protein